MVVTHPVWPRLVRVFIFGSLFVCLLAPVSSFAAEEEQSSVASPAPIAEPTPIPASEIPARLGRVTATIRGYETDAEPRPAIDAIAKALPETEEMISSLEEDILPLLEGDGPAQPLEDAEAELIRVERQLSDWQTTLQDRTDGLDGGLSELKDREALWKLTMASAKDEELPDNLVQQMREAISAIVGARKTISDRRAEVLTLQGRVAELGSRHQLLNGTISAEIEKRKQHTLRLDSPPLWKAFGETNDDDLGVQVLEAVKRNLGILERFFRDNARELLRDAVIFILVFVVFVRLGRKARLWATTDESLRTTSALLQQPLAASVLVTVIVLGSTLHSTAPIAVQNLLGVVLLLAVLRLLPHLVRRDLRPAIGMLVALMVLYLLVDLIPSTFFIDRIGELFLAVLGAAACSWAIRKEWSLSNADRDFWFWGSMSVAVAAAAFFALSAITNIIGATAFASLLAMATLAAIYDAIILWLFAVVVLSAVTVALRTTTARRLFIVRYNSDRIRSVLIKFIKVVAVLAWIRLALMQFGIYERVKTSLEKIFLAEYSLGDFSLSVSSVVVFIVVIWLSVKISQFISFVLDEDVLPRLDLPKGVPATISKTSTYVIVTLGVVIAVSAAGLDLSQATILVGALGVGIGFGLQNAVNNFVSGLILLFGRPINVGDKIQIDTVSGVVADIGIRATVVRTWQGAEVIVPNATLISDNLVNWTLSDDKRRMEIQVGVAYGAPAEKVVELLTDVARNHGEVLDDPEPKAIFTGFGDSSLDFELRAWTRGDFVATASDLRVGIDSTLAEHGIVIPFPQRDLHLRSVGKQAAARLAGDLEEASIETVDDGVSEQVADQDANDKGA